MGLAIPELPTVFLKPATSLADPWPAPSILPKITQKDNTGDYESELAIIIGKTAKDVSEADALDYVLGYTAANDVSSRTSQTNQTQWCFSKGFDSACPLGLFYSFSFKEKNSMCSNCSISRPRRRIIVSRPRRGQTTDYWNQKRHRRPRLSPHVSLSRFHGFLYHELKANLNSHRDMIFSVSQLVSFLSQGTTLPPGTVILTGTPPGVGAAKKPPQFLKAGEEFRVTLDPHVGTLVTRFENEQ